METRPRRRLAPASVIMIAAMFGVICAMVSSALSPVTYRAIATAFVSTPGVTLVADVGPRPGLADQVVDSFSALAVSPFVLDPVIGRLELDTTAARLATGIEVERPAGTNIITVTSTDQRPATAAAIANAVVKQLVVTSASLQPQRSGGSKVLVTQVQRAVVPQSSSGLALPLVVLLGLASGGGIATFALLIVWLLRRRPPSGGLLAPSMF